MPRKSTREMERHYFEQFKDHFSLPEGMIEYTDRPDVIVHSDVKIGIELANLYLVDGTDPASEQVQRHRRNSVLREAQSSYESAGGKNIELCVSFNSESPILDIRPLALSLLEIAQKVETLPTGDIDRRIFEHIPEIWLIYLVSKPYDTPRWRTSQVYNVPSLSIDRLREVVEDKNEARAGYQSCGQYWLLLIVDFFDFAQDQDINWPQNVEPIPALYDRIILYKPQFREYTNVPIRPIA